mmetsp:Transcript_2944/g.6891  ORF Transcript_2944/g.6891 Transcript_2944/m.6891 type:complete len:219 (-) Transcript_2944:457-1113(-)
MELQRQYSDESALFDENAAFNTPDTTNCEKKFIHLSPPFPQAFRQHHSYLQTRYVAGRTTAMKTAARDANRLGVVFTNWSKRAFNLFKHPSSGSSSSKPFAVQNSSPSDDGGQLPIKLNATRACRDLTNGHKCFSKRNPKKNMRPLHHKPRGEYIGKKKGARIFVANTSSIETARPKEGNGVSGQATSPCGKQSVKVRSKTSKSLTKRQVHFQAHAGL